MKHAPPTVAAAELNDAALELAAMLDGYIVSNNARTQALNELIREFETREHRRAEHSARDRGCYRTGAALEPNGGHLLDDIALSGLDHLGAVGLLLLLEVAAGDRALSLSQLLAKLFRSRHGEIIRQWGEWSRHHWLGPLVHQETVDFLKTKAGRDPKASWRSDTVTPRQSYIILEFARIFQIMAPEFATRGEAFDWIREQGGNPRFLSPPATPALPDIGVGQ